MIITKHVFNGRIHIKIQSQLVSYCQNDRGYSFINMLLSFFIYTIIITSLTLILHFLISHAQHPDDLKPFEWELFVIQLQRELKEASNIDVKRTEVTLTNKQGQDVSINHYHNLIRRQVFGKGHEIFLFNVNNVEFKQVNSGVSLTIISVSGEIYQYTFHSYKGRTGT